MPHWPPLPAWVLLVAGAIGAVLSRLGPILNWLHSWYQQRQLTRPQVHNLEALTDKTLAETINLLATRVEQQERRIKELLAENQSLHAELETIRGYVGEVTRSVTAMGGSVGPTGTVKLKAS